MEWNILFVDIDGVLNYIPSIPNDPIEHAPSGCIGIDDTLMKNLKYLCDVCHFQVVLSSTWRYSYDKKDKDGLYLTEKFKKFGITILGTTELDKMKESNRGLLIKDFIEEHKDWMKDYWIIDDEFEESIKFQGLTHYSHIDRNYGLQKSDCDEIIKYFKEGIRPIEKKEEGVD